MSYLLNVAIAIDQFGNAVLGGEPDETISSRVGRASLRGVWIAKYVWEPMIDAIFRRLAGQQRHCYESIEWDEIWDKPVKELKTR